VKVRRVVRRVHGTNVVSALNAVTVTNVAESDSRTGARSTQHVDIVQRNGHTEVREHRSDGPTQTTKES